MSRFVVSRRASVDLQQIWNHIAEQSFEAADNVVKDLRAAARTVADNPSLGHRRDDVYDDRLRCFVVHSYVIVYLPDPKPLAIVRVIHGARDFHRIFGP